MTINLAKSKVYMLQSNQTNKRYVGSTAQKYLCARLALHKSQYNRYLTSGKGYTTSFEIIKHGDCQIVLLEEINCANREQLAARERHWIENTPETVNKNVPSRTMKQYYQDKKAEIRAQQKAYRLANPEIISNFYKRRYPCECGGSYTKAKKALHDSSPEHTSNVPVTPAVAN